MESIDINDYTVLNEKLAYINGYLHSIAILNTIANNAMEHWMVDLGIMDIDLNTTIKKGIKAPNWTFKSTALVDWEKVILDDNFTWFSQVLYEIQGSKAYYENKERRYDLTEKYNLDNQLRYFVKMISDLLSFCKLKMAYQIEVDWNNHWHDPYFAHGECNYAFELESGRVLYLHFGAWD